MRVYTVGHGTREAAELVAVLREAGVATLVDVRRYPASRRSPHFARAALADELGTHGVGYVHAEELGGRRGGEPGEARFACIRPAAFAGYVARMCRSEWQAALAAALREAGPVCFLCAETRWQACHRRLIAELLGARGHEVVHLIRPGEHEPHVPATYAEVRGGMLHLCGEPVA